MIRDRFNLLFFNLDTIFHFIDAQEFYIYFAFLKVCAMISGETVQAMTPPAGKKLIFKRNFEDATFDFVLSISL